jgi:hypothetical protein
MNNLTEFRVTKASLIKFLEKHATQEWDERVIFGHSDVRYYNEFAVFMKPRSVHNNCDVVKFLTGVCKYAYRFKKYTWLDYTTNKDKFNHEIKTYFRAISKDPPWTGSDDIEIATYPHKSELIQALQQQGKKKIKADDKVAIEAANRRNKRIQEVELMDDKNAYELTKKILGDDCPPPTMVLVSKLIKRLQRRNQLQRFTDIDFVPYPGDEEDPTPPETINMFDGFYLEDYRPSTHINIEHTLTFEYLKDVWGFGSCKHPQFEYIMKLLSFFVQFPAERSGRIVTLVSISEGTVFSTKYWRCCLRVTQFSMTASHPISSGSIL